MDAARPRKGIGRVWVTSRRRFQFWCILALALGFLWRLWKIDVNYQVILILAILWNWLHDHHKLFISFDFDFWPLRSWILHKGPRVDRVRRSVSSVGSRAQFLCGFVRFCGCLHRTFILFRQTLLKKVTDGAILANFPSTYRQFLDFIVLEILNRLTDQPMLQIEEAVGFARLGATHGNDQSLSPL